MLMPVANPREQRMAAVRDRLAKSVFWLTWSRVTLQLLSLVSTIVVARLLDPTDYGLMALAGVWTSIVALLSEFGLGAAIVQFRRLEDRQLNACFWLSFSVALSGYAVMYVTAPFLAAWFRSALLADVLRVAALSILLLAFRVVPDGLLRRRLEFDKVSRAEIAGAVASIPVVVGMAWTGAGVWALVTGVLVGSLVQTLILFWVADWMPSLTVGRPMLREVLSYSASTAGSRICWVAYEHADAFILGKISGDAILGGYSIAKQLVLMPVEKIAGMVNHLAMPVLAELQEDRMAMRAVFLKAIRLVALSTFPLCVGLALVAQDLVRVVLTDKWIRAVPLIQILGPYALIRSVSVLLPPVLMTRFRSQFLLGYNITLLAIMPLAFATGAVWLDDVGVALAWVAVYPIVLLILTAEVLRTVDLSWSTLGRQLWPPIAGTLVMTASVILVRWAGSPLTANSAVGRLALTTLVGAAAYAATVIACAGPARGDIREVTMWLWRLHHTPTPVK